jgi:hypothetical protein
MGVLRSDYPVVTITIQRWQKNWITKQHAINFSGLVQEMLAELIRQRDPTYFEMNNQICDNNIQRKDLIKSIARTHPEIMPVNTNT